MFYKQQMCRNCGKKGHIAKVCRGEKVALHGTSRPNAPSQGNKPKFRNRPHRTNYVDCQSDSSDDDCSANTPTVQYVPASTSGLFSVQKSNGSSDPANSAQA